MVKGTKNKKDDRGKTARAKEAGDLKEGEYVAAYVKTESEPWVLGKVVKTVWCLADKDNFLPVYFCIKVFSKKILPLFIWTHHENVCPTEPPIQGGAFSG